MLDQLLDLIQQNSQKAVVQNPAVPNELNNDVMQTMMDSIAGGLRENVQTGNFQGLLGLVSGKSGTGPGLMNNPIVASIASNAISAIMNKFGLSSNTAGGIVSSVLPAVLSGLISKTSNPADNSIDFNSILGGFWGDNNSSSPSEPSQSGFDFNQIGYALADGKLDMNDLMRVGGSFLGKNTEPSSDEQKDGLDLGGMLGGLFGSR